MYEETSLAAVTVSSMRRRLQYEDARTHLQQYEDTCRVKLRLHSLTC
jgi:hypothetical protein